jgi:hypothetical protein
MLSNLWVYVFAAQVYSMFRRAPQAAHRAKCQLVECHVRPDLIVVPQLRSRSGVSLKGEIRTGAGSGIRPGMNR